MTSSSEKTPEKKPKIWRYALAFVVIAFLWMLVLELLIKPAFLVVPGVSAGRRWCAYLLPPFFAVSGAFALRWFVLRKRAQREAEEQEAAAIAEENRIRQEEERTAARLERQRFSLEILAVGVAVEYLRQTQVWDELLGRGPFETILSMDPLDYPSALEDKERCFREREVEALEGALGWLNDEWQVPVFLGGPALGNPRMHAVLESNLAEALALGQTSGRRLKVVDCLHDETPDSLLQKVFDFMDRNEEVPAVLLVVEDGLALRHYLREEDSPELLYDGPRSENGIVETVVGILLGRRDRIRSMRAFVKGDTSSGDPLKPYWEREQLSRSARTFTTTEWLPCAWSELLMERFSKLPVLGHLHRPRFVRFQSGAGDAAKADAFKDAWTQAMEYLGEGGKIQHLVYDLGPADKGRRLAPLSMAVSQLDPDFDVFDQGVNLHRRVGDLGAAAPFLGLVLAALACQQEGQSASSVFLRRDDGASLFLIRPSNETAGVSPMATKPDYAEV